MLRNTVKIRIVKYRLFSILFAFFIFFVKGYAQTSAAFTEAGDDAMMRRDYHAALQFYLEAAEAGLVGTDLVWKTAEAARQSTALTLALQLYSKVLESDEEKKHPLAEYWKAVMNKKLGNYMSAGEGFRAFIGQKASPENYRALAKTELKSCEWASKQASNPKDITIEHLGKNVNTPYSEFGAVQKNDTLLFSSLRFENKNDNQVPPRLITKIMETVDDAAARPMTGFNAESLHTASITFGPKQDKVIFCLCEYPDKTEQIRCDLYSRTKKGNGWSKPVRLPNHINMPMTSSTQPSFGTDEKGNEVLYFVSDRKEGKGKHDIWYSIVLGKDRYSAPVNLAAINTIGDEMTPFYSQKDKCLYFSSDGYETMGGLDIFSSEKKGGVYTAPRNMGVPLNSSCNDFCFYVLPDGREAYFSSNRMGSMFLDSRNETCCYDIYKAIFPTEILKPAVKDSMVAQVPIVSDNSKKTTLKPDADLVGKNKKQDSVSVANPASVESQVKKNAEVPSGKIAEKAPVKGLEIVAGKDVKKNKMPVPVVEEMQKVAAVDSVKQKQSGEEVAAVSVKSAASKPGTYRKSGLDAFLPLPLYFDNDEPDRNTTSTTTGKTYEESFFQYYSRKVEYMEKSGKGMSPLQKIQTEIDMMLFFEQTIKPNFEKLRAFTPALLYRLEQGDQYEIILKGYASPLAKNQYNNFLGQRRVRSLYNYWFTYQNNSLEKYFKNGQLKLTLVSFGEETAAKNISDDEHNEAGSIYNISAAKERRIEIIEVKGDEK